MVDPPGGVNWPHQEVPRSSSGVDPRSRRRLVVVSCVGIVVLASVLTAVTIERWYQDELGRIQEEIHRSRIHLARTRIDWLARFGMGGAELDYWLGACEEAEGKVDDALETWARITASSARHGDAVLRRTRLAIERGRFAVAEDALEQAVFPLRSPHGELRESYRQQLYLFTGRYDDLHRSIKEEWEGSRHGAEVLRKHWLVDHAGSSANDPAEKRLEEAGRAAPEDDRVWLGRAYLAIHKGRFAEADTWLTKCHQRRPDDPFVWRARLEWATVSGDVDQAMEAMRHVSAGLLEPEQILATRAWLAARLANEGAEIDALRICLERAPGDTRGIDVLIGQASRTGQGERVAQLRRHKDEISRAAEAYRQILEPRVPSGGFDNLGRLAEIQGRWFEAKGWWTLAARDPSRAGEARMALERIDRIERTPSPFTHSVSRTATRSGVMANSQTVADALADLMPAVRVPARGTAGPQRCACVPRRCPRRRSRLRLRQRPHAPVPDARDDDGRRGAARLRRRRLARRLCRSRRGHWTPRLGTSAQRDRLFRNRGDGTFEDVTAVGRSDVVSGRLRSWRGRGRHRQRRPARPVRHALAILRALPQPRRRYVRGRDRDRRPRRAIATGRPRRRSPTSTATATSTSTSATIPTGTRGDSPPCPHPTPARREHLLPPAQLRRRCPTMSSATTAVGSST